MAILGNFTRANYEALIDNIDSLSFFGIPSTATYNEVQLFWSTQNNLYISTDVPEDDLESIFGWVEEIDGYLSIGGRNNTITNLDFLSNLTRIGGYFSMFNSNLRNIDGLRNLVSIGGHLYLSSLPNITNVDGLSNLTSVGGYFTMSNNRSMENVDGLRNLRSVGGSWGSSRVTSVISFSGCSSLSDISGLENVRIYSPSSRGRRVVLNNTQITTLAPLNNCFVGRGYAYGTDSYQRGNSIEASNCRLSSLGLTSTSLVETLFINGNSIGNLNDVPVIRNLRYINLSNSLDGPNSYEDLGCVLSSRYGSVWRDSLIISYNFYVALWDAAYPSGRTGCGPGTTPPTPPDTTPDAYTFSSSTGVGLNEVITSNTVTITGIEGSIPVQLIGGENTRISINGGAYSSSGSVSNNDTLQIQTTSPNAHDRSTSVYVRIGFGLSSWLVSTSTNNTPVVSNPIPDSEFAVGDEVSINITNVFTDAEGHSLTYSLANVPSSLSINENNGVYTIDGTITINDIGSYNASVIADDGNGGTGVDFFELVILTTPTDDEFTELSDKVVIDEAILKYYEKAKMDFDAGTLDVTAINDALAALYAQLPDIPSGS